MGNRLQALQNLSKTQDILDQKSAEQQASAARLQMQQLGGQLPNQVSGREAQQTLSAEAVTAQAAPHLQAQQSQIQRQGQLQQIAQQDLVQQQQQKIKQQQDGLAQNISKKEILSEQRLSKYGIDQDNRILNQNIRNTESIYELEKKLGQDLWGARKRFTLDTMGRRFSNERQLADWMVSNAITQDQLGQQVQMIEQEYEKDSMLTQALHKSILTEMQNKAATYQQGLELDQQKELAELRSELEKKMAKDAANRENRKAMWTGALTIGGALLGGALIPVLGPAAPMVGAAAASGLSNIVSGSSSTY